MNDDPGGDPFNLQRFGDAQERIYDQALAEVTAGRKRSHWMWFIFPQLVGLGFSSMAQRYAIQNREEAIAYLAHPVLGPRLLACVDAVLNVNGRTAQDIFGSPDDLKLRSCATLFANVSPVGSPFEQLLEKYFGGEQDSSTAGLLNSMK